MALVNIAPKAHAQVFQLWKEGKIKEAMKIQELFVHADWAVGKIGGIAGLKAFVSKSFGYGSSLVRSPLLVASDEKISGAHTACLRELVELEKSLPDFRIPKQ